MNCENVKVGDRFAVFARYDTYIGVVTRTTNTRFEIGNVTFTKKDGAEYGNYYGVYVSELTSELEEEIVEKTEKKRLVRYLKEKDYSKLGLNTLRTLKNILKEEQI